MKLSTVVDGRSMIVIDRRLVAPKLFYFCWYGAQGALLPFVALYFRAAGLDLAQIGVLVGLPGLLQIVAAPLWGVLADVLRLRRTLLPLAIASTLVPVLLIGRSGDFGLLLGLVAVQALFAAPVLLTTA